jgi:peptide/nickel transport system substrate-binding protein
MDAHRLRALIGRVRQGALGRRELLQAMVAAGVPAMLAGVALGPAGASAQPLVYKPTQRGGGGVLRLLYWQGPTLLNPHFATGQKDQEGSRPFYEPLIYFDADALPVPVLAAEVPTRDNGGIAKDGRSTTWKLKRGVSWHDGKPFGADDVVFNWQYATDPDAAAYTAGAYEGIKRVEKLDSHTVRVVFKEPTPLWALGAGLQQIPKHLFDNFRGNKSREAPANLKPVGTGPYRYIDFKPGDLVKGELNPNYHLPNRPHFDAIEIKGGGDAVSAARAVLQTGEFDYAWNLLVEDEVLKRMEGSGKGRVVVAPGGTTEYMQFNAADPWTEVDGERASGKSRHPLLSERALREAMLLVTDRQAIQDHVYGRAGVATANILNNPAPVTSRNLKIETSIEKANALLESAGWKRGSDGVREKGGRKLKFVHQTSTNAVRQKVQAIFKQGCAKAGIEIELKGVAASVFFSSDAGNPDTFGKFWSDIQMYAFTRAGPDPRRFMQSFVSWETANKANKWLGMNRGRWANADYDAAFRAADAELDPVKRAALFIRMNDLVCNDVHVIPIVFRPDVGAVKNKVVAPLTAWDVAISPLHDWYRES